MRLCPNDHSSLSNIFYRLKRALERVDAGPSGKNMVFWTSLREVKLLVPCASRYSSDAFDKEPVIYISGRPHVLRLVNRPLENVECVSRFQETLFVLY